MTSTVRLSYYEQKYGNRSSSKLLDITKILTSVDHCGGYFNAELKLDGGNPVKRMHSFTM